MEAAESDQKSLDGNSVKINGDIDEKTDNEHGEEDSTDKSVTLNSSSGLETIPSSLEKSSTYSATVEYENKGDETDDDIEENLPVDEVTNEKTIDEDEKNNGDVADDQSKGRESEDDSDSNPIDDENEEKSVSVEKTMKEKSIEDEETEQNDKTDEKSKELENDNEVKGQNKTDEKSKEPENDNEVKGQNKTDEKSKEPENDNEVKGQNKTDEKSKEPENDNEVKGQNKTDEKSKEPENDNEVKGQNKTDEKSKELENDNEVKGQNKTDEKSKEPENDNEVKGQNKTDEKSKEPENDNEVKGQNKTDEKSKEPENDDEVKGQNKTDEKSKEPENDNEVKGQNKTDEKSKELENDNEVKGQNKTDEKSKELENDTEMECQDRMDDDLNTTASQNETVDEHDESEMDTSTGEKEFSHFLTQTPHDFDETMEDCDQGIVINDKDIIKAEDVFGRGKRCRTPKTDNIYTSEFDPDYNPRDETRTRRSIIKEPATKMVKQSSESPKKDTPIKKQRFPNLDISALELPAETGWRREIVVRNTYTDNTRRPADVYYKPPVGKKLRSMVEVSSYLRKNKITDLTEHNFSFIKTPISKTPFESVRNAGKSLGIGKKKPEIVIEKDSDEPALPFNGTSEAGTQARSPRGRKRKRSGGPGRPSKYVLLVNEMKKPVPSVDEKVDEKEKKTTPPDVPEMQLRIKTEPVDPDEHQEKEEEKEASFPECPPTLAETRQSPTMSPPKKKSKATARKSTTQKSFKPGNNNNNRLEPLCSLNCPGLYATPPTLQCNVCLCMFHPKCVNVSSDTDSFICLRCITKACSSGSDGLMNVPTPVMNKVISPPTAAPIVFTTTKPNLIPLNTFLANAIASTGKATSIATVAPTTSISTSSVAGTKIKKEPVDYDENLASGSQASSNVIGNVRNFLERKSTDINPNNSGVQYPVLKEGLQRTGPLGPQSTSNMLLLPTVPFRNTNVSLVPPSTVLQSNHFNTIPNPVLHNSIPGMAVRPVVAYPGLKPSPQAPTPQLSISSPVSLQPPRLIAAPGTKSQLTTPSMQDLKSDDSLINKQGQLLTLPPVVIKRLNLNQPVSLKINNTQVTVPPSSFLHTAQGLKLFLPKNTFPVNTGETAKLSVTVTNDKTLSLDTDSSTNNSDACGQLPTIVPNSSRTVTETPTAPPKRTRQYKSGINPASCFIQCLYGGFDCMLLIFEYLNVKDLFNVAYVCRTWRKLAMHQCLWREVRFKNMKIVNWEKAAKYLSRRAVEVLNLRGLQHYEDRNKTWHQLISVIHQFTCVHTIHFGAVPGSVLQALCEKISQLEELSAEWISDYTGEQMKTTPTKVDIGKFSSLANLRVLKLRGIAGLTLPAFSFSGGLSELKILNNLQKLSLTTLKEVATDPELEFLTALPKLTHLELGDCKSWTLETYKIIGKLSQLQSLRLECGGNSYDTGLAEAVSTLKNLKNLELIEYLVADNLYETLLKLDHLTSLKVWPDTSCQPAAEVNSFALYTVTRLKSLQKLEWGILSNKNSSIILDGEESNSLKAQNNQEWIPFLPASDNGYDGLSESLTEYISLSNFKDKLAKLLPKAKITVISSQTVSRNEDNVDS